MIPIDERTKRRGVRPRLPESQHLPGMVGEACNSDDRQSQSDGRDAAGDPEDRPFVEACGQPEPQCAQAHHEEQAGPRACRVD